jgi:hypothetical protein
MNREFNPTPIRLRALFATASLVLSTLVLGSLAGLATHYGDLAAAHGGPAVVAQR